MIFLNNGGLKLKFQNGDAVIVGNNHHIVHFTTTPPSLKDALSIALEDAKNGFINDSNIVEIIVNTTTKSVIFVNGAILTIPIDEKEDSYFRTLEIAFNNMED